MTECETAPARAETAPECAPEPPVTIENIRARSGTDLSGQWHYIVDRSRLGSRLILCQEDLARPGSDRCDDSSDKQGSNAVHRSYTGRNL